MGFPSKKVLLTGINGFTGVHLKCALEDAGYQVFGLTHSRSAKTNQFTADLSDKRSLLEVIKSVSPDYVIHLAAISFVAHGDSNDFYRVNVLGTENLLQAPWLQRFGVTSYEGCVETIRDWIYELTNPSSYKK